MSITKSPRNVFQGAHITPDTAKALKKEARRQKKSASALISEAVEEKLEELGALPESEEKTDEAPK